MSATLRKLLLVAPLTILFSAACFAQTTAAMEGEVKGDDGQPLKGAVIKIVRTDIKSNYNTKTDKKGHYYYGGLQAGTYRVSIEVDGKERGFQDHVILHLGGEPQPVNFDLKAQAATAPAGGTQELTKEQERGMTAEQKAAYEKNKSDKEEAIKKNKELNDAFNAGIAAQDAKQWDVADAELRESVDARSESERRVGPPGGQLLSSRQDKDRARTGGAARQGGGRVSKGHRAQG